MTSGIPGVRLEQLEEFLCRNGAGLEVRIIRFRFVSTETTTVGLRERLGAQGWKTVSNEPVKLLDRDLYQIVSSGEVLERVS